ncbi:MAG: hypothetical protein IJV24_00820 [Prevotella sp.]|nr:hypothetical protein [Prevotella sp.]
MKKQKSPILPSAGKYVARVQHNDVIDTDMIARRIQENCTVKRSDVLAVLSELQVVLKDFLQNGDIVKLDYIGRLKLEIEGQPVDHPADFDPHRHIRGVRIHLISESRHGHQALYEGLHFSEAQHYEAP